MYFLFFNEIIPFQDYDKFCHEGRSIQKKLLLSPSTHSERRGSNGTTAMFQPPISDIYLCDKCENEFYSLREVQVSSIIYSIVIRKWVRYYMKDVFIFWMMNSIQNSFSPQTHERQCRGDTPASPAASSPEPEPTDEDLEPAGQVQLHDTFIHINECTHPWALCKTWWNRWP